MSKRSRVPATASPRGGMIGVVSGSRTTYADFAISLLHVLKPAGCRLAWAQSVDVAGNFNRLCREDIDWLWILGDDHIFDPDLLHRLLAHGKDVIVPLCLKRTAPYEPVVFEDEPEPGSYRIAELPASGTFPVYAAGSAGMLVQRRVLDAIPHPRFEAFGAQNEDLNFCRKVREAGFEIWCDVDARLGHIGNIEVWPTLGPTGWGVELDIGGGQHIQLVREPEPDPAPIEVAIAR